MTAGDVIDVGFAVDESYVRAMTVAGRSVLTNLAAGVGVRFHVLDLSFPEHTKTLIRRCWPQAEVVFVPIGDLELPRLPTSPLDHAARLPPIIWAYLLLPSATRGTTPRLILLDSDVVVTGDLLELWRTDLGETAVGACQDFYNPTVGSPEAMPHLSPAVTGLQPEQPYLNSGVLLVDTEAWLAAGVTERALEFASSQERLNLPDQDALNVALGGDWTCLPPCWNYLVSRTSEREYRGATPRILHYCGPQKPWNGGVLLPHYQLVWERYAMLCTQEGG